MFEWGRHFSSFTTRKLTDSERFLINLVRRLLSALYSAVCGKKAGAVHSQIAKFTLLCGRLNPDGLTPDTVRDALMLPCSIARAHA